MRSVLIIAALLALVVPIVAAEQHLPSGLAAGGAATVTEVIDGDTVMLDNGSEVRLVGIQAPKLPLGRPNFTKWPLADEAKAALETLVLGRQVTLAFGGAREDRHGRYLAHLYREDGIWLQGEMLARGLARVYRFADNRQLIADLLAQEHRAREDHRGIWQHPYYAVLDHEAAGQHIGQYALVEGVVLDSAVVRRRGFLNFGADYRTDFTASIAPRDMKAFRDAGISLADYQGRHVRIRGWLDQRNGPMINVTHPEQIEIVTP